MSRPVEPHTRLKKAIKDGTLHEVPELLTARYFLVRDHGYERLNGFHLAAKFGRLKDLPSGLMTLKHLRRQDGLQRTSYHIAAIHGHLRQIPDGLHHPSMIWFADHKGQNLLHLAFLGNFADLKLIPSDYLTPACLAAKDKLGSTPIHAAAFSGNLAQLLEGEKYIKFDALFEKDMHGCNCFHYAAAGGHLDEIPRPNGFDEYFPLINKQVQKGKMHQDPAIEKKAAMWLAARAQELLARKARRK